MEFSSNPTFLEIVKYILSELESDDVDSISETVESEQVARICIRVFSNLIAGRDWPHLDKVVQLAELSTMSTGFKLDPEMRKILNVKYNKLLEVGDRDRYVELPFVPWTEFIKHLEQRDSLSPDVIVQTTIDGLVSLNILTNKQPEYYTVYSNDFLVLDSFNQDIEPRAATTSLQVFGSMLPMVKLEDTFKFNLPLEDHPWFINECINYCYVNIKQSVNPKLEQMTTSIRRRMAHNQWVKHKGVTYPDYGRKRK